MSRNSSRPTAAQFTAALRTMGRPRGRQLAFLKAHYQSESRALTMTKLAKAAKYASFHGVNLQYGLLGARIASKIGVPVPSTAVSLLAQFIPPKQASNSEWVLVMRPEFAKALAAAGWV